MNHEIPLYKARRLAKSLVGILKSRTIAISIVGSTRRWRPYVGGVDLLAAIPASVKAQDEIKREFATLGERATMHGDSVTSYVDGKIRCVLRLCSERNWAAALLYYTGNTDHNRHVTKNLALCSSLNLHSAHGMSGVVLRNPQGEPSKIQTEREIYDAANMPYFPPECREHNVIPPDLFSPRKYGADYCTRSIHGRGMASIDACVRKATELGLKTIALCDRLDMVEDPRSYLRDIERVKPSYQGRLRIYAALDLPIGIDGYLHNVPQTKRLDFLAATLYREPSFNPEMRILTAMDLDPRVKIIYGAPITATPEWRRVFMEMARRGVALGIESSPDTIVSLEALRSARAVGVKFALGSGAYSVQQIARVVYAEKRARRALLTNQDFAWAP